MCIIYIFNDLTIVKKYKKEIGFKSDTKKYSYQDVG